MGGMIAFIILALVMVPVFFVTVQLWHAGAPAPVKSWRRSCSAKRA